MCVMRSRLASAARTVPVAIAIAVWAALAWMVIAGESPRDACRARVYRDPVTGRNAAIPPARISPDGVVSCR